ncbi:MAG: hypothetical protein GQ527_11370 [Bacteroidales bacterium]|nr:hypothetical protein [Bacteroidales bacterium]
MTKIPFILSFLFILLFSSLQYQTVKQEDSLVLFKLVETALISNPPPKFIIEIKNDRTISFYSILPDSYTSIHSIISEKYSRDSCNILLDSTDYFSFEQLMLSLDLENINNIPKRKLPENGPVLTVTGCASDEYTIKTAQHSVVFYFGCIPVHELLEPFLSIRNRIKELEKKYQPL